MNVRSFILASVVGGVAIGLLSNLPVVWIGNCVVCMWLWAGGILAVWLYRRLEGSRSAVTVGRGALLGAVAGLIGAVIGTGIIILLGSDRVFHVIERSAGLLQAFLGKVLDMVIRPALVIRQLMIYSVVYSLFGAVGGLIAGSILGKPSDEA